MTETMQAVVIEEFGGPEVLELREVPRPVPAVDEIRIRVRTSGLNRADLSQRRGRYPAPPGSPADIPGLEFAGTVESMGSDVRLWSPGDRVMGIVAGGGYAEKVAVHGSTAVRVPNGPTLSEAGAVPEVYMTAYDAVFLQAELRRGDVLLVHAVGSGVGTAAVQLARRVGARTIGTSRTAAKLDQAGPLGLDIAVAGDEHWPEAVLDATDGGGVDVILDMIGGDYLPRNLKALAVEGRVVQIALQRGPKVEMNLLPIMLKRLTLTGSTLRPRTVAQKAMIMPSIIGCRM